MATKNLVDWYRVLPLLDSKFAKGFDDFFRDLIEGLREAGRDEDAMRMPTLGLRLKATFTPVIQQT
ncbi:MAG: hypothetical protein IPM59_08760 [Chloracidobacterium sp.]|nr:hypothetical protein [Chloracidobacterium sp.]